jgi:serine/threonine-protein kinase
MGLYPLPLPDAELNGFELLLELESDELSSTWAALWSEPTAPLPTRFVRLADEVVESPELCAQFLLCARAVSRIRHPSLLQVYDVGACGGSPYVAFEHVFAVPLGELLERARLASYTLPFSGLMQVALDVADVLSVLHRSGGEGEQPRALLHGDLGPHAVLITADGGVKVAPTFLGAAACSLPLRRGFDQLAYKAPEQLDPRAYESALDPRADVFAFGALFWEAFAGRRLFQGASAAEVRQSVLGAPVPRLDDVVDSSQGLTYVLQHALDRDPDARFEDGVQLRAALGAVACRMRRGFTARRRYSGPDKASRERSPERAVLAEAFQHLVGPEFERRQSDLKLLFSST